MLDNNLEKNFNLLKQNFIDCGDFVIKKIPVGAKKNIFFCVAYIDMLVDRELIDTQIITRLTRSFFLFSGKNIFGEMKNFGITTADFKEEKEINKINLEILSGNTVLLFDGFETAIIISSKKFPGRGIESCEIESVVYGSKDSFTESMRKNTALIRRRIRDINLKIKQMQIGKRSKTDIAIVFLKNIARDEIVNDLTNKLEKINIDAILDIGYLQQFLDVSWKSIFPQSQLTERPDKSASAILEGRIIIICDNSPFVLIVPATLPTFFQSSEDYYERWQIMNFLRIMRYVAAIISICLPGFFLALSLYHPNMIPIELALKLAEARKNVPFSSFHAVLPDRRTVPELRRR